LPTEALPDAGQAEVVSIHVHLLEDTQQLIDRAAMTRFKPGALLATHTLRSGVVDERALVEMLGNGRLAGACLE